MTARQRRLCLGLYATAGILAAPWVAEWLLFTRRHRPSPHLGVPSIKFAHHRNRRHHR